ncbi:MAG: APC family permease [Clostridia bacterium]
METKMKEKYGLFTAISMVVGIVIGSGIFFKAGKVLNNTGGNMLQTLVVVAIVGLVMIICSLIFASLATRYEKVNGIVDYAEVMVGPKYGYFVAWFMTTIYYPSLTSCLAWVSAQYTCALFGFDVAGSAHVAIGAFYLVAIYAMNALSPKIGGKFQVSTTVIKLIPLVLMAVVGTIAGLVNGLTVDAFVQTTQQIAQSGSGGMLGAIVAFAFAYEGWIIATSINAELKNSKKNLPKALIIGAIIVIAVYLCYFLGLTGSMGVSDMINAGDNLPGIAFTNVFGRFVGSIIYVLIVISCLGTTNGLMMGSIRGAYSIAARRRGIAPDSLSEIDPHSNAPTNSAIVGLLICTLWFFYWQICFFQGRVLGTIALPAFMTWEPDELPIITLYGSYIPIFISMMIKEKNLSKFQRVFMPLLGVIACGFMVFCAFYAYGIDSLYYLALFAIVMVIGAFFMKEKKMIQAKK